MSQTYVIQVVDSSSLVSMATRCLLKLHPLASSRNSSTAFGGHFGIWSEFLDNIMISWTVEYVIWLVLCSQFCSSLGQGLCTSTYIGEINYAMIVGIVSLILFGLLIGNMQVSLSIDKNPWVLARLLCFRNFWTSFLNLYLFMFDRDISSPAVYDSNNGGLSRLIRRDGCVTGSCLLKWRRALEDIINIDGVQLEELMKRLFWKACQWISDATSSDISALI